MIKKFAIICMSLFIVISCSSNKKVKFSKKIEIVDKIELEKPYVTTSIKKLGENFIGFTENDKSIIIFNKEGDILYKYKKIGKGPGEYIGKNNLQTIGIRDGKVYIFENNLNKIMTFDVVDNKKLKFKNEYNINKTQAMIAKFGYDNNIYLTTLMSNSTVLKYDKKGNYLDEYIEKEKKDLSNMKANEIRDFMVESLYIPYALKDKIILIGPLNKKIKIYKGNKLYKNIDMMTIKSKGYDAKTKSSKNRKNVSISENVYQGSNIINNNLFITLSPRESYVSYILKYNLKGEINDKILVERKKDETLSTFYFTGDDKVIFRKKVKENEKDKFKDEKGIIYIGKMIKLPS